MKKLLSVLAAVAAIGLGVQTASAAGRCDPVLTPGEYLNRLAANCPPSTREVARVPSSGGALTLRP